MCLWVTQVAANHISNVCVCVWGGDHASVSQSEDENQEATVHNIFASLLAVELKQHWLTVIKMEFYGQVTSFQEALGSFQEEMTWRRRLGQWTMTDEFDIGVTLPFLTKVPKGQRLMAPGFRVRSDCNHTTNEWGKSSMLAPKHGLLAEALVLWSSTDSSGATLAPMALVSGVRLGFPVEGKCWISLTINNWMGEWMHDSLMTFICHCPSCSTC